MGEKPYWSLNGIAFTFLRVAGVCVECAEKERKLFIIEECLLINSKYLCLILCSEIEF